MDNDEVFRRQHSQPAKVAFHTLQSVPEDVEEGEVFGKNVSPAREFKKLHREVSFLPETTKRRHVSTQFSVHPELKAGQGKSTGNDYVVFVRDRRDNSIHIGKPLHSESGRPKDNEIRVLELLKQTKHKNIANLTGLSKEYLFTESGPYCTLMGSSGLRRMRASASDSESDTDTELPELSENEHITVVESYMKEKSFNNREYFLVRYCINTHPRSYTFRPNLLEQQGFSNQYYEYIRSNAV